MTWLLLLFLVAPGAWAESTDTAAPPQGSGQPGDLDAIQSLLTECEGTIGGLQGKVDGLRRSKNPSAGENLSDVKQARDGYKKRCGELSQSLIRVRQEGRSSGRPISRDLVDLERRLMGLGRAERKVDGGIKVVEVEQQRKLEAERRKAEADQRHAANEQKRKENAEQRETESDVRRLKQQLPAVIHKGKEILDDK